MDHLDLITEQSALRFMLGIGPPVRLDIKPVGLLTESERELFAKRLATVTRELETAAQIAR